MVSGAVFYWIGVVICGVLAFAAIGYAGLFLWFRLIDDRFRLMLFRRTNHSLSVAQWDNAKLSCAEHFSGNDWPINDRPFYLSYRFGKRRLFIMAGIMGSVRQGSIKGQHPNWPTQGDPS